MPQDESTGAEVLRRLIPTIYAPWAAMALGVGVLTVALPLYLLSEGASFTATSVVLGASGFGAFVAAVPSGGVLARKGERAVLIASLSCIAVCLALTAASSQPAVLAALQLAVGGAATAMRLAGLTLITRTVAPLVRGRANSTMGGIRRFGAFIGPLLGGWMVDELGYTATFLISAALTIAGLLPLLLTTSGGRVTTQFEPPSEPPRLIQALRRHGRLLLRSSSGPVLIMAARRGRAILLPLVAVALGVNATTVGVIVAVGTGADLLLFPAAGWLMDHFGRLRAIIPAFTLMALGLIALAYVDTTTGVVLAGTLIGVGNGLSAGTMMTLASDLAPEDSPSQFIAGFAAMQDLGQLVGPVLVGVIADAAGLGAASITLAVLLIVGVTLIVNIVGETSTGARLAG